MLTHILVLRTAKRSVQPTFLCLSFFVFGGKHVKPREDKIAHEKAQARTRHAGSSGNFQACHSSTKDDFSRITCICHISHVAWPQINCAEANSVQCQSHAWRLDGHTEHDVMCKRYHSNQVPAHPSIMSHHSKIGFGNIRHKAESMSCNDASHSIGDICSSFSAA